jgi:hypothetical protein
MLNGVVEYEEANGLIVTERWQDRNRRDTDYLQDVLLMVCQVEQVQPH